MSAEAARPAWRKAYRHGTLVVWPPDPNREAVNALRRRYDPASQAICEAHITLTQPLRRTPTPDDLRRLEAVVAGHPAFRIDYGPLGTFLPYPCIWLEIQPAKVILELRRALHDTGLFDLDLPHPEDFVPHMTITESLSGPEVDEALFESLRDSVAGGSFPCADVAHIVPDDAFRFSVRRRLPLAPS